MTPLPRNALVLLPEDMLAHSFVPGTRAARNARKTRAPLPRTLPPLHRTRRAVRCAATWRGMLDAVNCAARERHAAARHAFLRARACLACLYGAVNMPAYSRGICS